MAKMMPGDWNCGNCGDHQFARNTSCRKCGAAKDEGGSVGGGGTGGGERPGDWICPNCDDLQFARNSSCRKCGTPKPEEGMERNGGHYSMHKNGNNGNHGTADDEILAKGGKPGDWICPGCDDLQFARNTSCRRCGAVRTGSEGAPGAVANGGGNAEVRPGDWNCPNCDDLVFARNSACRKCGTQRPGQAVFRSGSVPTGGAYVSGAVMGGSGGGGADMRPGDWMCPGCGDHQFAKNDRCRKCSAPRPNGFGGFGDFGGQRMSGVQDVAPPGGKPGDWICTSCQDLQFARNAACRRCGAAKPASAMGGLSMGACSAMMGMMQNMMNTMMQGANRVGNGQHMAGGGGDVRPGDWTCPNCSDNVFAKNDACRRCGTRRPSGGGGGAQAGGGFKQTPKPGDWYCPSCKDLQFARNTVCRLCDTPRPADEELEAVVSERSRSRSPRR